MARDTAWRTVTSSNGGFVWLKKIWFIACSSTELTDNPPIRACATPWTGI